MSLWLKGIIWEDEPIKGFRFRVSAAVNRRHSLRLEMLSPEHQTCSTLFIIRGGLSHLNRKTKTTIHNNSFYTFTVWGGIGPDRSRPSSPLSF